MSDLLQILQKYKDSRIALYGLGIETEKIIRRYGSQFLFTGLLDGYREEGSMYGMPVISFQEAAESGVKLILVVARPGSCRAIAKKMKQKCICNQIDLYDVRGRDLCADETVRYDLKNIEGITKSQLNQAMDAHSILSFDLFDTLIMRNTLFYTDIFDIMNSQLKSMGILIEDFSKKRTDAEKHLSRSRAPVLEEIYCYLLEENHVDGISAQMLAQMEWEIDLELVVPRRELCELAAEKYVQGKPVYIVSDSYYDKKRIERLLEKCGIDFYTELLISCEYGAGKTQTLFSILKEKITDRSCLHIGDDLAADVEAADRYGLDSCRIYSGIDLLEAAGYLGMWDHLSNLSDRIKAGIFTARLFNSPFWFENDERKIGIGNAFDLGYLLFAPMITDFVVWFQEQVVRHELKNIWFCARDGYLIKILYDELVGNDTSVYFLTSRIAVVRAGVENAEDIRYVGSMKFAGSLKEQLKERFGILLEDKNNGKQEAGQLTDYSDIILEQAAEHRRNYLAYIDGLHTGEGDLAFFDFVAKGTCQFFVQKLVPNHCRGFYFLQLEKENSGEKDLDIEPFYSTEELENSAIYENYYILETILTSGQPSVSGFDTKGRALYAQETRSREDLECSSVVQEGIRSYFHTYLNLCPKGERIGNKKLDERMLELIHGIEVMDDAFRGMIVEDPFFNRCTEMGDLL